MKIMGGLLVIIGSALMSSSLIIWGAHWIYHLLTSDAGFFVSLIYSVAGLLIQLASGFVLFVVGVAYYSPDSSKRKVDNWK